MNTIDVWAQVTTQRMMDEPWMDSLLRWTKQSDNRVAPRPQDLLKEMDKAGVQTSIIAAWHGPKGALISNDEVSDQIDQSPDRLKGLISVDLNQPMQAVREIRKWHASGKFVGVRVVPWLWGLPPDDRRYYPIYTACVDLGIPFCTQIGHTGPLLSSETGRLIPYLENVLLEFPELVVVGGHVGFPWINELISLTVKFPNFYVDTSAYVLHRLPSEFVAYMKGIGQQRVMFGTNWPMISASDCLKNIDRLKLTPEQERAFRFENAQRVFGVS